MTDNTPPKPKFKKRKKKNKNRNIHEPLKESISPTAEKTPDIKPNTDDSKPDTNTTEDDDLSFFNQLKQAKSIHKLQFGSKNKGLVFEETHEFTSSGLDNPENFKHDPSKDFGESFSTEKQSDDILKFQRKEWVQKEMRARLLEQGRILPESDSTHSKNGKQSMIGSKTTLKEELYALSDRLSTPLTSAKDNNEAGERWLAGMSEYELPLDNKLANIKQTEDAKQKLLEPKERQRKIFEIPRNYNGDFTTHHFDRVKLAEHKRKLQETKQSMDMEREKKRRRLMGTQWFNDNMNSNE